LGCCHYFFVVVVVIVVGVDDLVVIVVMVANVVVVGSLLWSLRSDYCVPYLTITEINMIKKKEEQLGAKIVTSCRFPFNKSSMGMA
jgi:hypothetical protein